jgi:hypothetical protein
MFLAPEYFDLNVIARFSVSVFPLTTAELPARLTAHCEFCTVVPALSVLPGVHAEASLSSMMLLDPRLY